MCILILIESDVDLTINNNVNFFSAGRSPNLKMETRIDLDYARISEYWDRMIEKNITDRTEHVTWDSTYYRPISMHAQINEICPCNL